MDRRPTVTAEDIDWLRKLRNARAANQPSPDIPTSVVRKLLTSEVARTKMNAILRFAQALRLNIVAECVEESAILEHLKTLKVSHAQGFGVHPPRPIDELAARNQDLAAMYGFLSTGGYHVDIEALKRTYPEVAWASFADWATAESDRQHA